MEKCLVCIIAQARDHELTWDSFIKCVLDQLNADLALCVGADKEIARGNSFYRHAKYIWEYEELQDYADAFDYAKKVLKSNEDWRILLKRGRQWLGGIKGKNSHSGSAAILIFYRWLLGQKLVENDLIDKYDRFIVTRSDYLYCAPHPPLEMLSPDHIWMPEGETYGGYTDRHLVASSKDIIKCIDLMDDIILAPEKLYRRMRISKYWNLERVIALHFKKNKLGKKVRIFPPVMFTVRGEGTKTRWKAGEYDNKLGLYIKYCNEFERSYNKYCKMIKNNDDWAKVFSAYDVNSQVPPDFIFPPLRLFIRSIQEVKTSLLKGWKIWKVGKE